MNSALSLSPLPIDCRFVEPDHYHPSVRRKIDDIKLLDLAWFNTHPEAKAMRRSPYEGERLIAATHGAQCRSVEVRKRKGTYAAHLIYDGAWHEGQPVALAVSEKRRRRRKAVGFG